MTILNKTISMLVMVLLFSELVEADQLEEFIKPEMACRPIKYEKDMTIRVVPEKINENPLFISAFKMKRDVQANFDQPTLILMKDKSVSPFHSCFEILKNDIDKRQINPKYTHRYFDQKGSCYVESMAVGAKAAERTCFDTTKLIFKDLSVTSKLVFMAGLTLGFSQDSVLSDRNVVFFPKTEGGVLNIVFKKRKNKTSPLVFVGLVDVFPMFFTDLKNSGSEQLLFILVTEPTEASSFAPQGYIYSVEKNETTNEMTFDLLKEL